MTTLPTFNETRDLAAKKLVERGLSICDAADMAGTVAMVVHGKNSWPGDHPDLSRLGVAIAVLKEIGSEYEAIETERNAEIADDAEAEVA